MISLISPFVPWVRVSKRGAYKYGLTDRALFNLGFDAGEAKVYSLKGEPLASWKGNILTIEPVYKWDGMTGYPDTKKNKAASLAHDLGYQLSNCDNCPFTKEEVDAWLYDLQQCKVQKRITLLGVQAFGGFYWGGGGEDCRIIIQRKRSC